MAVPWYREIRCFGILIMNHPHTKNPPVPWWELWPGESGDNSPPSVRVIPTEKDCRRFYAFPVVNDRTDLSQTENYVFIQPEENGWSFLSKEIRFGNGIAESVLAELRFSCYDISANRTLFENLSPLNFSSYENGSVGFAYLLPYRHTLKFVFPTVIRPSGFSCSLVGQLIRGVV